MVKVEMTNPVYVGSWDGINLSWRCDAYGDPGHALYAGGLCIGWISNWGKSHPQHAKTPWRSWLMTDDEGAEVGWHVNALEARDVLVVAALKQLLNG